MRRVLAELRKDINNGPVPNLVSHLTGCVRFRSKSDYVDEDQSVVFRIIA
jgi:hypothetical protein